MAASPLARPTQSKVTAYVRESGRRFSRSSSPWLSRCWGWGAYSIDAKLFGRRRIVPGKDCAGFSGHPRQSFEARPLLLVINEGFAVPPTSKTIVAFIREATT
jgi:hypothetical protein